MILNDRFILACLFGNGIVLGVSIVYLLEGEHEAIFPLIVTIGSFVLVAKYFYAKLKRAKVRTTDEIIDEVWEKKREDDRQNDL